VGNTVIVGFGISLPNIFLRFVQHTSLSMMPSLTHEGKMVTGGAGFYNGESAFAIGFTGTTGRVSYKMESARASSGDTSYGAGFGYKF